MKYVLGIIGIVLMWCSGAAAQTNVGNVQLLSTPSVNLATTPSGESAPAPDTNTTLFANAAEPHPANTLGLSSPAPAAAAPAAASPQDVYGVFQNFPMEVYFGYTFYRFYEVPSTTPNLNGFNLSMQYYIKDWFGLDGEYMSTWGSQSGVTAHGCFGGGGPRVRWGLGRGVEVWGHGMIGEACFNPQTPFGSTTSLSYQVGGGVDINAHHHRFAYRFAADMIGSTFYGTNQYSPKFSAGIVFKF